MRSTQEAAATQTADHRSQSRAWPGWRSSGDITIRKLQIFWSIAHTRSLTQAAKLLGVSQPSLSQQLGSLETAIGARLFDRLSNSMALSEVGEALLAKAENVLRSLQEFEDSLPQSGAEVRRTIRIAGVTSAMRVILPHALRRLRESRPLIEFDVHEGAPAEILDMLYSRRANLGLMAANSVAEVSAGFKQHFVAEDPYVLVVPASLDLGRVRDPLTDLSPTECDLLNSTVQFVFGNQHSRRIQDWYDQVLPENRLTARARSFEVVLGMVRSGLGVCVAPALSALNGAELLDGIRLYGIDMEPRRIVAMIPTHCRGLDPYPQLLEALQAAGAEIRLPATSPMPPFVAKRAGRGSELDRPALSP